MSIVHRKKIQVLVRLSNDDTDFARRRHLAAISASGPPSKSAKNSQTVRDGRGMLLEHKWQTRLGPLIAGIAVCRRRHLVVFPFLVCFGNSKMHQ